MVSIFLSNVFRKAVVLSSWVVGPSVQNAFCLVTSSFQSSIKGPVVLPPIEERMNVLAVGVILLGVLIFLLSRLRQRRDRQTEGKTK